MTASPIPEDRGKTVGDVMGVVVASVRSDEQLDLVQDVMNLGRIRHLPVVDEERLVGVVSQRDLLAAGLSQVLEFDGVERRSFLHSVSASEVMSAPPITAGPELTLVEAARRMLEHQIGCLPVVDEAGHAIGILSEADLLRVAFRIGAPDTEDSETLDVR